MEMRDRGARLGGRERGVCNLLRRAGQAGMLLDRGQIAGDGDGENGLLALLNGRVGHHFHPHELTINKRLFTSAFFQIADGESSVRKTSAVKVASVKAAGSKAASAKGRPRAVAAQALPSVRERILEVAERMFAEHGMSGVGLRAITTEAEVNLASIAYHFDSKDGLLEALFAQRAAPIAQERVCSINALRRANRQH